MNSKTTNLLLRRVLGDSRRQRSSLFQVNLWEAGFDKEGRGENPPKGEGPEIDTYLQNHSI